MGLTRDQQKDLIEAAGIKSMAPQLKEAAEWVARESRRRQQDADIAERSQATVVQAQRAAKAVSDAAERARKKAHYDERKGNKNT